MKQTLMTYGFFILFSVIIGLCVAAWWMLVLLIFG